jgi:hypothetical protein
MYYFGTPYRVSKPYVLPHTTERKEQRGTEYLGVSKPSHVPHPSLAECLPGPLVCSSSVRQTILFIRYRMAELMTRILQCALVQVQAGDMHAASQMLYIALSDAPSLLEAMTSTWRYGALVHFLPKINQRVIHERLRTDATPVDFELMNAYLCFDDDVQEVAVEQRRWF